MRNIAIMASGEGAATERIIKIFNNGNRVKTVFLIVDNESSELAEKIRSFDVEIITVSAESLDEMAPQLAEKFIDAEIVLLVDDNFSLPIPEVLIEDASRKLLKVSSPEQAPREVIDVLEADFRKEKTEIVTEQTSETENPTLEHEWAKTLKINFTPPQLPVTPPPVPENSSDSYSPNDFTNTNKPYYSASPKKNFNTNNPGQMPPTYLIWAILTTVFCCFIPGIIAIIFASQVSSKFYAGDIEGAWRSSRTAEIWIIVSVVLGVLTATLYLPFMLLF